MAEDRVKETTETVANRESGLKSLQIQPFGFLLVTDLNLKILGVSDNIDEFLGLKAGSLLGKVLPESLKFVELDDFDEIASALGPVPETFRVSVKDKAGGKKDFLLTGHREGDKYYLEFEALIRTSRSLGMKLVSESVAKFRTCTMLEDLLYQIAQSIRALTDYERVLVYKFDENWDSQVLAEAQAERVEESFLYRYFSSKVIPFETREIYKNSFIRIIPDLNYESVGVATANGENLDLNNCFLRGVSPSHLSYMKNLGVNSAVILSIVIKGELWGLVVAYGYQVKELPHRVREACVSLSHLAAASIEYQVSNAEKEHINEKDDKLYHLTNIINSNSLPLMDMIELNRNDFSEFIDSSGFAVVDGDKVHNYLSSLSRQEILDLRNWIVEQNYEGIYSVSNLSRHFDKARGYCSKVSGVLAISPSSDYSRWIFWFRKPVLKMERPGVEATIVPGSENLESPTNARPFDSVEVQFADKLKERLIKHTLASTQKDKEKLEAHREFLASIVDSSKDGIVGFSSNREIISWNQGASDLFGLSASEVIGQPLSEIFGADDEVFSLISIDPSETIERKITRVDGQTLELSMKVYPIMNTGDSPIFGAAIIRDITAQKQAERELLLMSQQLVETNRQLEEYAWVAAHDLKEPVRTMGTYARLVFQDYEDKVDEEGKEMLNIIFSSASNAMNRIDDILSYSSLGRSEFSTAVVDLDDILSRVVKDLGHAIKESGGKVVSNDLPSIMGNADMLSLLFQNLISNAIKFRSDKPPVVDISGEVFDDIVLVKVADNGIGVSEKHKDHIFGMFKRLDTKYPGTGLGLSIVRRIVELHGGKIWLESEPGKGTTFNIEFRAASKD